MTETEQQAQLDQLLLKYRALASRCKSEGRMVLNHVCLRVENLDDAAALLQESFGLPEFLSPGGETFEGEKEYRVAWLDEHDLYLELSQYESEQQIGYDTGAGQPIGHLSEVGFFVPNMDSALSDLQTKGWQVQSAIQTSGARMMKLYSDRVPGLPVELIDLLDPDDPDFLSSESGRAGG
ncbi:MAG: VOC family protein [Luminiphilus sp.]